jgi:hypothetical protein
MQGVSEQTPAPLGPVGQQNWSGVQGSWPSSPRLQKAQGRHTSIPGTPTLVQQIDTSFWPLGKQSTSGSVLQKQTAWHVFENAEQHSPRV